MNYLTLQLVGATGSVAIDTVHPGIGTLGGPFTHDLSVPADIADGTYRLIYTPSDYNPATGGQFGVQGERVFTIDNTAPSVSNITIEPRINGNIGGSSVVVEFTMTDATGVNRDRAKTHVSFVDGPNDSNRAKESVKVAATPIGGDRYRAEFNTRLFVKDNWTGSYNLSISREDTLGNRASIKPVEFRNILIDNSGPTSIMTSPSSNTVINGVTRFSFDVADHTGVKSGYVQLNLDGVQAKRVNLVQDGTSNTWYADVDVSDLANGSYTVDARFVDVFERPRYGANKGTVVIDHVASVDDGEGENNSDNGSNTDSTTGGSTSGGAQNQVNTPAQPSFLEQTAAGLGLFNIATPQQVIAFVAGGDEEVVESVLGVQSSNNKRSVFGNGDTEGVLGATAMPKQAGAWNLFGLGWYWWLLVVAAVTGFGWWLVAAIRRRQEEAADV